MEMFLIVMHWTIKRILTLLAEGAKSQNIDVILSVFRLLNY